MYHVLYALVFLFHVIFCVVVRPYARGRDMAWEVITSVLSVFAMVARIAGSAGLGVGTSRTETVHYYDIATAVLIGVFILLIVKVVCDFLCWVYITVRKRRIRIQDDYLKRLNLNTRTPVERSTEDCVRQCSASTMTTSRSLHRRAVSRSFGFKNSSPSVRNPSATSPRSLARSSTLRKEAMLLSAT